METSGKLSDLGCPSAPAPSIQYRASNLDWQLVSYMILYMFHLPCLNHIMLIYKYEFTNLNNRPWTSWEGQGSCLSPPGLLSVSQPTIAQAQRIRVLGHFSKTWGISPAFLLFLPCSKRTSIPIWLGMSTPSYTLTSLPLWHFPFLSCPFSWKINLIPLIPMTEQVQS